MQSSPILLTFLLLFLFIGCSAAYSGLTNPQDSQRQSRQQPRQTSECRGYDLVSEIRAEWAANYMRARKNYEGERYCLRGAVGGFDSRVIFVVVGEDVRFAVKREIVKAGPLVTSTHEEQTRFQEENNRRQDEWEAWLLTLNNGDTMEAYCTVEQISDHRQRWMPYGTPIFEDCEFREGFGAE